MRSESEMMSLIMGFAERDERVRAVYMNGSRTNPNAPKDIFQDYDIVYVVRNFEEFKNDH
ncbi:MAG: aminoglycoside 6-adenylyltransferase, partial [Christensenellaceae bacterium]|nr:aminoglycoside 6-adenylyltransferase [Christensenellaceae bacterium]